MLVGGDRCLLRTAGCRCGGSGGCVAGGVLLGKLLLALFEFAAVIFLTGLFAVAMKFTVEALFVFWVVIVRTLTESVVL